jgi:hypothetical protein
MKFDTIEKIVANKIKIWRRIESRIGLNKEQVTWHILKRMNIIELYTNVELTKKLLPSNSFNT